MTTLPLLLVGWLTLSVSWQEPAARRPLETVTVRAGELSVVFRDNSRSPGVLSGVQSLFHLKEAPAYDAFDPDGRGSSAGLNFEHIISGHRDDANRFTPRHGRYSLYRLPDGKSVLLERRREDSPWAVSSTTRYTVTAPEAIDFGFRCVPHDASRFGERGYAIFFWADYMNEVDDVALHFRGIDEPGGDEKWISADAPRTHPDWNGGGTYRSAQAPALDYDADHDFKLNVWSYDYPRFTKPFYVGRAANGMALILMFDRLYGTEDEIRFSLFKFKVRGEQRRPAWDFQYVIHRVESGKEYGYDGRLLWKRFVSYDDCLAEYERWARSKQRAPPSRVVEVDTREELAKALASAGPGTRISLGPGTYRGGLHARGLEGAPGNPVVIRSRDREDRARIAGGSSGLHLSEPRHVEIRDLVFEGASVNGLNIDDGGSFETPARDLLLRDLIVKRVGPRGNKDGIKLSGVADFRVESCRLEAWGDGGSAIDMVGCRRGAVRDSTFRHGAAPNASGVQAKGGSRDITVSRCRFEDAGGRAVNIGGSTGLQYFRPRPEGFEAKDIIVEDCFFIGSAAPVAFVGVDGAVVRHNTIYRPGRWVVRILQETDGPEFVPCRGGRFENNIIAYRSNELRTPVNVGSGTAPKTFRFRANVWFAIDRPAGTDARIPRELPVKEVGGVYGTDPLFVDAARGELELKVDSPVRRAGVRPQERE